MTTTIAKSSKGLLSPQNLSSLQKRLAPFSTERLVEMVDAWTSGSTMDLPTTWTQRAACKGVPTEVFVPGEDMHANTRAEHYKAVHKMFCASCPVKLECIAYCMLTEEAQARAHDCRSDADCGDNLDRFGMFGVGPQDRRVARKLIKQDAQHRAARRSDGSPRKVQGESVCQ
jgi:hypothetical protein